MTHTALQEVLLAEYEHSQRRCYTSATAAQTAAITIATDEMCITAEPGSAAVRLFTRAVWSAPSGIGCSIANAVTNRSAKTLRRQNHTWRKATCGQQDFTSCNGINAKQTTFLALLSTFGQRCSLAVACLGVLSRLQQGYTSGLQANINSNPAQPSVFTLNLTKCCSRADRIDRSNTYGAGLLLLLLLLVGTRLPF